MPHWRNSSIDQTLAELVKSTVEVAHRGEAIKRRSLESPLNDPGGHAIELGEEQNPRIFQRIARTVADLATTIHGPPSVVLVPAARRDELEIAGRVPNQKLDGHTAALER